MTVESLTPINNAELLEAVKSGLNISGEQFDTTLQLHIDEVKEYLKSAGVSADVVGSTLAVGCISRGVADLWNYGNGDTKLSEYFYQRAIQLTTIKTGYEAKIRTELLGAIVSHKFTVEEETDLISIGINGYNQATDNLSLFVNGFKFDEDRYAVLSASQIKLTLPVKPGTEIEIVVTKLKGTVG